MPTVAMTVEKIMTSSVHSIHPDMTVRDAILLLLKHHISGAPVVDSSRKVMSVVSEGDLLKLAASQGLDKTIFQCMIKLTRSDKLITIAKTEPFTEAYKKFLTQSVHRLIVVDNMGRLEGLVSRSNVLRILADPDAATATQKVS